MDEDSFNGRLKSLIQAYNNGDINPFQKLEDVSEPSIINFINEAPKELPSMEPYFLELERQLHGFEHRIRQLKKSGQWGDQPEFLKILDTVS